MPTRSSLELANIFQMRDTCDGGLIDDRQVDGDIGLSTLPPTNVTRNDPANRSQIIADVLP